MEKSESARVLQRECESPPATLDHPADMKVRQALRKDISRGVATAQPQEVFALYSKIQEELYVL